MTESWSEVLDRAVDEKFPQMVAVRRHLHADPEPSGAEDRTSLYLYRLLGEQGFAVRLGPEGRGVLVDPADPAGAPRIAVRADIDALKIHDAKQVDYRSQVPGVMHACGHDAHSAALVGAVMALAAAERAGALPWPICWRGILQPAEETSRGALAMIAAGALQDVDAIVALHVDPTRDVGRIGIRAAAFTASCDDMTITLAGRGGHAARPHESIDPISAAAQLVSSVYLFVPRAVDSRHPVVVTIGQILGGDNPNVIPEQVVLRGTLRTLNSDVRERTKTHIRQLARGLAEASGVAIAVEFEQGPPSVQNDESLTALIRAQASDLLGIVGVQEITQPSMGGEDFAYYLEHVPGSMFRLGCRSESRGGVALHAPQFDIDEEALRVGAKMLARTMVAWSKPGP